MISNNKSKYNPYWVKDKQQEKKEKDNHIRYAEQPEHIRRFYNSKWWKRFRHYVLEQYNYLCQDCLTNNIITEATEIDHIKPLSTVEGWNARLELNNVNPLCKSCHAKKTVSEIAERKKEVQQIKIDSNMDDLESHLK